jgi:signal transduction histidine kinase
MANMLANAIDAYEGTDKDRRGVRATLEAVDNAIVMTVTDWGKGIPADERNKLFEPFYSTKKTGMGMGLFIAKQIAEEQFHGSISLDTSLSRTAFIVTLAKA